MTTSPSTVSQLDILREDALANIERLFKRWGLQYVWINAYELDFLNPSRIDKNLGAVRFNTKKGFGADFAGVAFGESDFNKIGQGLDKSDFGFSKKESIRYGFDIIGLCQRIHQCDSYRGAARLLETTLKDLDKETPLVKSAPDASIKRKQQSEHEVTQRINYANNILKFTKDYTNTLGETYLHSRSIILIDQEPTIRFHPAVMCKEINQALPTLIFKIQPYPDGEIRGIHRIYLKKDGTGKAEIDNQKMALGEAKHNAIWFGKPCEKLFIAEGPENALTLRVAGARFVACSIFAANMSMLEIPKCVKEVIICPDRDTAGLKAAQKSKISYSKYKPSISLPKKIAMPNGKYADLNDILMGVK